MKVNIEQTYRMKVKMEYIRIFCQVNGNHFIKLTDNNAHKSLNLLNVNPLQCIDDFRFCSWVYT